MLKNYLKIAFRNLVKNKLYALINVLGLAFGLACVMLISLYVADEWSYDRFHTGATHIYRVEWFGDVPQTRTPYPMALALKQDFPEVMEATSLTPLWGAGLTKKVFSVKNPENDVAYDERGILGVDSTFLKVFDFKLIHGNKNDVLRNVGGVLISESYAHKYFEDENPIGKYLSFNSDKTLAQVEGVFEDVPHNSHFHFDILLSYVTLKAMNPNSAFYSWDDFGHYNYIKLKADANASQLEAQLLTWIRNYVDWSDETLHRIAQEQMHFFLDPLTDIHLKSHIRWELEPNGNIEYVYIMATAASLILIIACVNFMNLSTSQSVARSKEIGVRKSLGAHRSQLTRQFLGESLLISAMAIILAGLLAEVSLPGFNYITGKQLHTQYLHHSFSLLLLVGIGAFVGLAAGLYPALFLSSIDPVVSMKGVERVKASGFWLRNSLVVFQFLISMILITGSIIINDQLYFMENKDLGFDKSRLLNIPLKNDDLDEKFFAMKNELKKIPGVEFVSGMSNVPGLQFNQHFIYALSSPQNIINVSEMFSDDELVEALGLTLLEGRMFSRNVSTDAEDALVVNEAVLKALQIDDAVGKEVMWERYTGAGLTKQTIIGVVKNFNYQSLHEEVKPLVLKYSEDYNYMLVKIEGDNYQNTITQIRTLWGDYIDRFDFEYSVLSDDLSFQYLSEEKTAKIFSGFSFMAILIACFGLFGLASLSFEARTKEVGIRKVLGASVFSVLALLLKDFSKMIMLAIILAIPLAWYLSEKWLNNFIYKIAINPFVFVFAGVLLVLIAWLTLSYLTYKAAKTNPVEILKDQ
ncbi:ABC transporter permease [Fulvivirga sediminis]|uniref:ABC transporter permease n=1 Tax=Fulvivirga sediminis TaxID=2803949 RepID=A0A937F1P7_9BACT|nr:ABC transporter permease [Fulvivirga sediminis]MBL3654662.1 ABC transporter permease [Fulvivirga sediminis]